MFNIFAILFMKASTLTASQDKYWMASPTLATQPANALKLGWDGPFFQYYSHLPFNSRISESIKIQDSAQ